MFSARGKFLVNNRISLKRPFTKWKGQSLWKLSSNRITKAWCSLGLPEDANSSSSSAFLFSSYFLPTLENSTFPYFRNSNYMSGSRKRIPVAPILSGLNQKEKDAYFLRIKTGKYLFFSKMAHLYAKCLPRNSLSAWAPGGSTSGVNHCVYLIEFQVDHNQCEWMGVYRASLRAARQIPFSGLQGNDPVLWLQNFVTWNFA